MDKNKENLSCKNDTNITDEKDLRNLSDDDLASLFIKTDVKRKELENITKLYWMCVAEINRRIEM